jgi:8-oxo-dGTP pyrophosphatase MutT (NUDIX family)
MNGKTYIDKVALIHIENRKLLHARSRDRDAYYMPGGKRKGNETDVEVLQREIKEELNVDILPKTLAYYGEFTAHAHNKPDNVFVRIKCYTGDFVGQPTPANEVVELKYLDNSDAGKLTDTGRLIAADLKTKGLID